MSQEPGSQELGSRKPSRFARGLHSRARDWSPRRRVGVFAVGALLAGIMAAGSAAAFQPDGPASHRTKDVVGPLAPDNPQTEGLQNALAPSVAKSFKLAPATRKPPPAPPALADQPGLESHEVFGFAPYWTLPMESDFDYADLTTLDYFGLDVNGNGTIARSGDGWNGYQSQDFASLIASAHAAGDRVVLTAECFDQTTLNQVTSSATAATTLGNELVKLVEAKNLDGVNIDFEGEGSQDQAGLSRLMAKVSSILRTADKHWQITMDTYASSAGDPDGFYDIQTLAPSVDAFFVMAYQMGSPEMDTSATAATTTTSSTSTSTTASSGTGFTPATGGGVTSVSDFTARATMQEYTQVVSASQVILGLPFYGYEWPTTGPGAGAEATGPATPVEDSTVLGSNDPVYWNAATDTAWTSVKSGSQWYQIWFEDPTALSMKAHVAESYNARGVGIWSLGMDGNDPQMLQALVGNSPVVKEYSVPPSSTTSSSSTTTSTVARTTTTTVKKTKKPTSSTTTSSTSSTSTTSTTSTTDSSTTTTTDPSTTTTSSSSTTSTTSGVEPTTTSTTS